MRGAAMLPVALSLGLAAGLAAWSEPGPSRAPAGAAPAGPDAHQTPACGPGDLVPRLNDQPNQWKAGLAVKVWVDRDGTAARGSHRNDRVKFKLNDREAQALFDGVNEWGGIPETGVTFSLLSSNEAHQANHWFTVAWPAADVVLTSSDGALRRLTCRVPPAQQNSAAYSCAFEDQVHDVSQSHTIVGAVTMLNTQHQYVDPQTGNSHETWGYRAPGWRRVLAKVGAHETGHLMGLDDMPALYPDGRDVPHVMKPLNGTNDMAPQRGKSRLAPVSACDRATVLQHPSRQYQRWVCAGPGAVAPPPCSAGAQPVCRDPASRWPAPVWACAAPSGGAPPW